MKNTDILTGRIVQRVLDARKEKASEVQIYQGISDSSNIDFNRLINNLFEFFPDSKIALKRLQHGYELSISEKFLRGKINVNV